MRVQEFRETSTNGVTTDYVRVEVLLDYKMWVESTVWHPEHHVENLCTEPLVSESENVLKN